MHKPNTSPFKTIRNTWANRGTTRHVILATVTGKATDTTLHLQRNVKFSEDGETVVEGKLADDVD
jgi:hypothetical protein